MQFVNSKFNVLFQPVNEIRRKGLNLETNLKSIFQTPLTFLPIPEDAPFDIPRINGTSIHGHTSLSVSKTNIEMTTKFDGSFLSNWNLCCDYLRDKISVFDTIRKDLEIKEFLFCGLTTNFFVNTKEEFGVCPLDLITDRFVNLKSKRKPVNYNYQITFSENDIYYINFTFQNLAPLRKVGNSAILKPSFEGSNEILSIILDVNDRYAFNKQDAYISDNEKINAVLEISKKIISEKINAIIMGDFEL